MATLIGRVGMVVKGAWDSSVAYDTLDVVTYNNNTYIAKQASPAGTLPTNTTYWQLALDASQLQPKEAGKGLSTNDYDNTAKGIVDSTTSNLASKADKVSGATNGNLASLDSSGNLADGGVGIGNTSIAGIGDGSITGAIFNLNSNPIMSRTYSFSINATTINTHISSNGGYGGRTILYIASSHSDVGDATLSEIGFIRCGYSGNHATQQIIAGQSGLIYASVNQDGEIQLYSGQIASALFIMNK